ncbi:MAG: hypothetical protein AAGA85_17960 [Bacteroidota bacterium]
MKLTVTVLAVFLALSLRAQTDADARKVGLIYDLSSYIYHKHVAFMQQDNFDKYYEQDDSLNVMIQTVFDETVAAIPGLYVEHLDFFGYEEVDNIVKNRRNRQLDRFDMLIVVHDAGVIAPGRYETLQFKGRGISTNYEEGVMIYGNLRIEIINMENRQRRSFDIDEHDEEDLQYKAVRRVIKNFYEVGQKKEDLREDQVEDIHRNLAEMYRIQIDELLGEDRLGREVVLVMQ